jgi:hypothetical protein
MTSTGPQHDQSFGSVVAVGMISVQAERNQREENCGGAKKREALHSGRAGPSLAQAATTLLGMKPVPTKTCN